MQAPHKEGWLVILTILTSLLFSCKGEEGDLSSKYAPYIKAYTSGIISDASTIRVEFASALGGEVKDAECLLSFSPLIKGEAHWLGSTVLEFVPNKGQLRSGVTYKASLKLDKLTKLEDKSLRKFKFGFTVAPKLIRVKSDGLKISMLSQEVASISGTISFSSETPSDSIAPLISLRPKQSSASIEINETSEAGSYKFEVSNIPRKKSDETITLTVNAKDFGYESPSSIKILIPGQGRFFVIGAENDSDSDTPCINVCFSQPLDGAQDPEGLFTLKGVKRYYFDRDGNKMRIYYERQGLSPISLYIDKEVKSSDGTTLGSNYENNFACEDAFPSADISVSGTILPDPNNIVLPFTAQNLTAVDISIIKVYESNILNFLQENSLSGHDELRRNGRLVYRGTMRLDTTPGIDLKGNNLFCIDLSKIFKKELGAIYRVRLSFRKDYSLFGKEFGYHVSEGNDNMTVLDASGLSEEDEAEWDEPYSYYSDNFYDWQEYSWKDRDDPSKPSFYMVDERFPYINLLSSDIGLIAKRSSENRLWVSVTQITSTEPLSKAKITAYNYQLKEIGSATTNPKGLAELELSGKPFLLTANHGGQKVYLKLNDGAEKTLSRFDTSGEEITKGLKGFVYGERGVWRPGDTLHLNLILYNRDEVQLPDSHPVTMELYSPRGQFYTKQINTTGVDGFYSFDVPTVDTDPTGYWNAYFKVGGATFHKTLSVEAIKPNRLKVNLKLSDKVLSSGSKSTFTITSNWLTGPVASGLKTSVEMYLRETDTFFKSYKDYIFSDPNKGKTSESLPILEGTLDDDGSLESTLEMPKIEGARGPLLATFSTQVFEQGGESSISSSSALFSPYPSYVGIKIPAGDQDSELETDTDHVFKLVVLDKDGQKVPGHRLEYYIYKINWSWWWESRGVSYDSYINSKTVKPLEHETLTATDGEGSFKFRVNYPDWGRYLVYVKDLDGGHATGGTFCMDWPDWRGHSDKGDPEALTMLSFTTDKKSYNVGEKVSLYLPAAPDARALVSLENSSRVLSQTWVRTSATETKYSFEVTKDMAPNFYIHVTLLQRHSKTTNNLPIRMYGVQPVLVTNPKSHLDPKISVPEVLRPQEPFIVKVSEASGKAMTYTLAIVDEGLLDITSFKTPDPWKAMYAREALGVRTWDLYDDVVGAFTGQFSSILAVGGDEGLSRDKVKESRFNPVVKVLGPFTLKGGSRSHKITLPMYVGSVRIMVVAGHDGAFGSAEKAVPVRSPIMVLPTLPRVLGCEETVTLPVNVFAMEDDVKSVGISVSVEGPITIEGPDAHTLSFDSPSDKVVRFKLKAGAKEGIAKVQVKAEGSGGHKAEETINIPVRNPNPIVNTRQSKLLEVGQRECFKWDASRTISAQMELTSFPGININETFNFVRDYDYYCTEQLSARGIALVYSLEFLNSDNATRAKEMIPQILQKLYSRQLYDGGFSYWDGGSVANEWVSSMAGQFMIAASEKGFKVDKGVIRRWITFQQKCSLNYTHSNSVRLSDLQQSYRLYTLALAGAADEPAMNILKSGSELSAQAAWRLVASYCLRGKKNIASEIAKGLSQNIENYKNDSVFGSSLRDKAMILESLVLLGDIPGALSLAEKVAEGISVENYTTQTAAFCSVAMAALAPKMNTGALVADVDGKETKSALSIYSTSLDRANSKVEIKNLSSGPVYASVVTSSQDSFAELTGASSSGLIIARNFYDLSENRISPSSLKQTDEFYERIEVTNTTPEFQSNLALTQMLPSGWEIVQERLYGIQSQSESDYDYKDLRDDRVSWFFPLGSGNKKVFWVKLQASYEGSYTLPAASASAMYDNKIYGRSDSERVAVVR